MTTADMPSATENHQSVSRNPEISDDVQVLIEPCYLWESLGYLDKIEWRRVSDAEWNVMAQSRFYAEFSANPDAKQIVKEGV